MWSGPDHSDVVIIAVLVAVFLFLALRKDKNNYPK